MDDNAVFLSRQHPSTLSNSASQRPLQESRFFTACAFSKTRLPRRGFAEAERDLEGIISCGFALPSHIASLEPRVTPRQPRNGPWAYRAAEGPGSVTVLLINSMVYCGKPSAGCGACRARKVKCDQARPACNRCTRIKRICPGYRDQLSLLFRDESRSVAQKALQKSMGASRSTSPSQSTTSDSSTYADDTVSFVTSAHAAKSFAPDSCRKISSRADDCGTMNLQLPVYALEDSERFQATCFFFGSYSWLYAGLMQKCDPYGKLPPSAPLGEKAMMNAMISVGMASLSNLRGSQSLRIVACREYSRALKWTNAAISDRKQATEDTTLAAILCLSLFELLTCQDPNSITDFVEHTKGAVALLELRGEARLGEENAVMLFYSLRNEIIAGCIVENHPVPPGLLALSEKTSTFPDASMSSLVGHRLTVLASKLCEIRLQYKNARPNVDFDLLSKAFVLDREFVALAKSLPAYFDYDTGFVSPGEQFDISDSNNINYFGKRRHKYTSWPIGIHWNNYRYFRIVLNGIIADQLKTMAIHPGEAPLSPEFKEMCRRVCEVLRNLACEICESVPSVLELGHVRNGHNRSLMDGLALLLPLFMAAAVDGPGKPVCDWVCSCLTTIGVSMGINQALTLVHMLQTEPAMTCDLDLLYEPNDDHSQNFIDTETPLMITS